MFCQLHALRSAVPAARRAEAAGFPHKRAQRRRGVLNLEKVMKDKSTLLPVDVTFPPWTAAAVWRRARFHVSLTFSAIFSRLRGSESRSECGCYLPRDGVGFLDTLPKPRLSLAQQGSPPTTTTTARKCERAGNRLAVCLLSPGMHLNDKPVCQSPLLRNPLQVERHQGRAVEAVYFYS